MAGSNSTRAILFALGANFSLAVAKGVAAFVTGSSAMLAETVHSFADCGNQGLLILGLKQSKRPPSPEYPLGYGKAIYFWSFLVAVMLFTVGGMFSLYEGIHKLQAHEPVETGKLWWAAGVLVFGIIVEGISLRACMQEIDKVRAGRSYWRWFRESRQAELVVIFGEDMAALLGLTFALVAVLLTMATGNPLWDAIGTIMIGALLIVVAVFVAIEVKALLIGSSMDPSRQKQIGEFVRARAEIDEVLDLVTLQMGNDVMLAVKAKMHEERGATGMLEDINTVECALKDEFPEVRWVFFEPDFSKAHP